METRAADRVERRRAGRYLHRWADRAPSSLVSSDDGPRCDPRRWELAVRPRWGGAKGRSALVSPARVWPERTVLREAAEGRRQDPWRGDAQGSWRPGRKDSLRCDDRPGQTL